MVVKGFQLPAAFVQLADEGGLTPDHWQDRDLVDAYGSRWDGVPGRVQGRVTHWLHCAYRRRRDRPQVRIPIRTSMMIGDNRFKAKLERVLQLIWKPKPSLRHKRHYECKQRPSCCSRRSGSRDSRRRH